MEDTVKDKIVELRVKERYTFSKIALELDIPKPTIIYNAKKLGLTGKPLKRKLTEKESKIREYKRVKTYRQKQKLKAVNYLGGKCVKCGYNKCIQALEFHHRNPLEKEFSFSKYSNHSWTKIEKELDKCDLLCANCHREEHYL